MNHRDLRRHIVEALQNSHENGYFAELWAMSDLEVTADLAMCDGTLEDESALEIERVVRELRESGWRPT